MKKLVVVADDFGLCESVNEGIIEISKNGIVTELSLMLGSPGTDDAITRAYTAGIQNVGIHILLKNWRDTGNILRRSDYIQLFDELSEAEVAELVQAELAEFERVVGHKPSHITSQHGVAMHAKAVRPVIDYAVKNNIPMRQPMMVLYGNEPEQNVASLKLMQEAGVRTTDHFFAHIMEPDYQHLVGLYQADLDAVGGAESVEIGLHPGKVSDELQALTSLANERERDLRLATDEKFKQWLREHNISVVPYSEISHA